MTDEAPISRVVETIKKKYRPEKIILFGSRVWGQPDSDSDLDVLIIKRSRKREIERMREAYRLVQQYQRRPYRLSLDILVKTPAEVSERLAMGDDFLRRIIEDGKVVYERVAV